MPSERQFFDVVRRLQALERRLLRPGVAVDDTGWIEVEPLSLFVNNGGQWSTCAYRRKDGIVYVKGYLSGTFGTPSNEPIILLPEGFRPIQAMVFEVRHAPDQVGMDIRVLADGTLYYNGGTDAQAWFSLDGIAFPADG